jgi:transposase
VKNVLEGSVKIVLVCPRKQKPERGEKTDFRDARNLAHLHRHGLLRGSYLPSRDIVELRDLTRRREKLQSNLGAEKNRIQKVLEAADVKIGNIISDVFGVSGQAMVSVLISGREMAVEQIADLSKRRLRQRIPELKEALERHQMNEAGEGLCEPRAWLIISLQDYFCDAGIVGAIRGANRYQMLAGL